jgi:hypothetical protein
VSPAARIRRPDLRVRRSARDRMTAASTARSRRCRQRQRQGLIRLAVEVEEDSLCDWLVAGGVLSPLDTDQRSKVEEALAHALALLISGSNNQA